MKRVFGSLVALAAMALAPAIAQAQTRLKWAHVYEVGEPYHTEALWAAEEIKKRTNGKYEVQVFAASQLGNENQINEGLGLGTVDMIYTGVAFAGSIHKPIAISNAPYVLRDFNHWKAYRDSKLFRDIAKGYEDKTRHKVVALNYYGQRHLTANREIKKPEDMKGMKLRVPPAPLFLMFTKSGRRERNPDRLRGGLPAPSAGHRRRPGEPASHHHGEEVLRGAVAHHAVRAHHRVACHDRRQPRLGQALGCREEDLRGSPDPGGSSRHGRDQRPGSKLAAEFRKLGKTVVEVDREAFRKAAAPLHNDASAGAGWTKAEYDELQKL
jgi:TRAP-type C4-dicarboxylate transport system substrate-binding protein